jgi:hypothetical protein
MENVRHTVMRYSTSNNCKTIDEVHVSKSHKNYLIDATPVWLCAKQTLTDSPSTCLQRLGPLARQ